MHLELPEMQTWALLCIDKILKYVEKHLLKKFDPRNAGQISMVQCASLHVILLMEEILHQLIWGIYRYLQG